MKRLRLRKIWVVLAVFMLLVPLLSGKMQKSEATGAGGQPTSSEVETTTSAPLSGQAKLYFRTGYRDADGNWVSNLGWEDKDGTGAIQWNMEVSESNDFNKVNTGFVEAFLSIDGKTTIDQSKICDRILWTWSYVGSTTETDANKIMTVEDLPDTDSSDTEMNLAFTPQSAGIIGIYFTAVGYDEVATGGTQVFKDVDGDDKSYKKSGTLDLNRTIYIGSPLQIFAGKNTTPNDYALLSNTGNTNTSATGLFDTHMIYANNADLDSCQVKWFFVDATTELQDESQGVILKPPYGLPIDEVNSTNIPEIPENLMGYTSSDIVSIEAQTRNNDVSSKGYSIFPYLVSLKNSGTKDAKAGFVRVIGRIYLDGKSTSGIYIEDTVDIMVVPQIEHANITGKDTSKEWALDYGDYYKFTDFSNDVKDSLEWKSYLNSTYTSVDDNSVLLYKNADGITANNYGEIYLRSMSMYSGYEKYDYIEHTVRDWVKVKVNSTVLKGEENKQRVPNGTMEVISVGGTITLCTNVVGSKYSYEWRYVDEEGNATHWPSLTQDNGGYNESTLFASEGVTKAAGDGYSSIKIRGKKSGEDIKVCCIVTNDEDNEKVLESYVTIRIIDTMSLSESSKTIAVGGSFTLEAYTSINNGSDVKWAISEEDEEFISIESSGPKTAVVTGLKATDGRWIYITATQEINGTTVSANCRVKVIPGIDGAEIIAEPDSIIPVGGVADLSLILNSTGTNFTKDEIKWILKDKDGTSAEDIVTLKEDPGNILEASVIGKEVGEAYVAVVTNDTAQTQIAVITIRVVSEVSGIKITGDKVQLVGQTKEVLDYLDEAGTGTCQLGYILMPEGFVNEELPVVWSTNNEMIAKVDPETGLVTYQGVGTVIITVSVAGIPSIADTCTFTIENPATGIELEPYPEHTMKVGETVQMKAKVIPETVTDAKLTWATSDSSVITIDQYGLVTAVGKGSAIVTATTTNGKEERCVITVLTPAEGIELNYQTITVKKGTIFYLSAKVLPEDAYDKSVTFTSGDDTIATVDPDGTVTTLKVGTVEILVTSNDNPDISAICTVIVTEAVSGLTLNSREITIDVGEQYLLKATVKPSDAVNTAVTFESADPSIATVDEKGLITGVKGGVTVVFVKTVERGLMASCTVTVQEDITSITLSETETYVGKGKNKRLTATILPTSATQKKLLWESSDESIVIVDQDGNIHGVNLGTAIITATARDEGKVSATCKVTVVEETTKITLNQSIIRLMQNDTFQLTYTIEPATASVKRVSWSTADASVARVDSLGLVRAIGEGETTIRATATDGSGVYAECTVIVTPLIPVTRIQVNTAATTMLIGDTRTLTARVNPRNATEGIRWVSSDTSIATVNNNGYVEAVGAGICEITAISSVTGLESVSSVTVLGLNATDVTLEQYDSFDLYLDGVTEGITWFSRNKRVATVTKKGVVTARKAGTTDIVARVNGKLVACQITVEKMKK